MTDTLVTSSRRGGKSICRRCGRTVHIAIVQGVDGPISTETDPELISVVIFETRRPQVEHARRLHAERCDDYARERDRAKLADERKVWNEKQARKKAALTPAQIEAIRRAEERARPALDLYHERNWLWQQTMRLPLRDLMRLNMVIKVLSDDDLRQVAAYAEELAEQAKLGQSCSGGVQADRTTQGEAPEGQNTGPVGQPSESSDPWG